MAGVRFSIGVQISRVEGQSKSWGRGIITKAIRHRFTQIDQRFKESGPRPKPFVLSLSKDICGPLQEPHTSSCFLKFD